MYKTVFVMLFLLVGCGNSPDLNNAEPGPFKNSTTEVSLLHEESFEDTQLMITSNARRGFDKIKFAGLSFNSDVGAPQLPVKYLNMIVPLDAEINWINVDVDSTTLPDQYRLLPVQKPRHTNAPIPTFEEPDPEIYSRDALFPNEVVTLVDQGVMAGSAKIVRLRINPVQYNPATGKLQWNKRISIELDLVESKNGRQRLPQNRSPRSQKVYQDLLEKIVVNKQDVQQFSLSAVTADNAPTDGFVDYLIVAPRELLVLEDNTNTALQKFIDWKREKGWSVRTISYEQIWDAGYYQDDLHRRPIVSKAGGLRKFLYDQHTQNGVTFVLLVGDETNSPVMYKGYQEIAHENIPSDLYFADFDGDWNTDGDDNYGDDPDYVKDIFVGRLLIPSNSKGEMGNWVEKLLVYETNPGSGDPSYVMNAFFLSADDIYQSGSITPLVGEYLEQFGFNVTLENEWYDEATLEFGPTGTQAVQWMRDKKGIAALDGHGSKARVHVATTGYNQPPVYAVFSDSDYWCTGDWPIWEGGTNDLLHDLVRGKYQFYHSTSCDNAGYDINFGYQPGVERWVSFSRMFTSKQSGIGGPAIIANTRYGWYVSSPNLRRLFFQVLLEDGDPYSQSSHKIGVAEAGSKALQASDYLAHSSTLFGDPEMDLWTQVPNQLFQRINLDLGWVLVYEIGDDGSQLPVAGALVAFFDGHRYTYATTNEEGIASRTSAETLLKKVTATKINYIPSRRDLTQEQ